MSAIEGDTLIPRKYQEEVFVQAQEGNIIAALGTGSGKTFISILLIRWIATKEASQGKAVVFLVPKVALVEQQGDFIAKHTSLRVIKLHGALDIDLTDRAGWQKKFLQNDVFVMTAQIFLNLITHSLWNIPKVSLIVFDECHHTRKNHPYNSIMREYKHVATSDRPKIFGMTASPILNPRDAIRSMEELEANLDATIVGIQTHVSELMENSPKPSETIQIYPPPPLRPSCPISTLWASLTVFDIMQYSDIEVPWAEIERRYRVTLHNLGPFSASLYLHAEMWHQIRTLILQNSSFISESAAGETVEVVTAPAPKELPAEVYHIAEILLDFQSFFILESNPTCSPLPIPLEWCTPKIKTLVDVILAHHSSTFQGIVFVEQRQTAMCLAKLLPNIPQLNGLVRCADLVGHGVNSEGVSKDITTANQGEVVKSFRAKEINLLIATSVAEEGLDFPACDLVIRFDKVQHLVGYVQSRGRARNKASNFVIMVQNDDIAYLSKYQQLCSAEPELKAIYQARREESEVKAATEEEEEEILDPLDLAARERYDIPSTGAFASYDNSISLLNYLCSLIPCDRYTPQHVPVYTGDFQSTLRLPAALPIPSENLLFHGPVKRSKKEAKRAVAFQAVKHLHALDVFDDYLLPVSSKRQNDKDLDGRAIPEVNVPETLDVPVRDPWTLGPNLWMHAVFIDGRHVAGLITGTKLPEASVRSYSSVAEIRQAQRVPLTASERVTMDQYTRQVIWHRNTARETILPLSLFLVPMTSSHLPDFDAMNRLLADPQGTSDWSSIGEQDYNKVMVLNRNQNGRPYLLHRIRHDLTPMSTPPPGSPEATSATYYEFFVNRWTRKKWTAEIPTDGPMIEVTILPRSNIGSYTLESQIDKASQGSQSQLVRLLPLGCCGWLDMSYDMIQAYQVLPQLSRRITDIYRACQARFELGLPPILDDLLVQALTIPGTQASFNNQRLETLGDAVLELCTTVHLFNKYPYRHEGQLDNMRQGSISNRFLMVRALDAGLHHFVTGESHSLRTWRYVLDEDGDSEDAKRYAQRTYPRRSLQDCMEATLGAAFITGGIPMALHAGFALGLAMGDPTPWPERYGMKSERVVSSLFSQLEERLGYRFRNGRLLVEAVTHPSFASFADTTSYQRLEFLGDALLDLVVVHYLYAKFPEATSEQLALPRTKAVCSAALAFLGVKHLDLHTVALINNVELSMAMEDYVPILKTLSSTDIVTQGYKYDPPKVISDIFESVMGAVLIDSGYNYELAAAIVEYVMEDILVVLSPTVRRDPVTELYQWVARSGCRNKIVISHEPKGKHVGVVIHLHSEHIVGPIVSSSLGTSKFAAAERALGILRDDTKDKSLDRICNCSELMDVDTGIALESMGDGIERLSLQRDGVEESDLVILQAEGANLDYTIECG
ncbi:P-loop containing nucleoside triphosphate hydrolase protein [Desarmillaria tabescens]|uniref:P-loop containing nucleoside triphosphate hydrolase protein n=1 Tax=Armillaria tabescens TaxID=1929756 RepID=A0AA39KC93_ARMTA|nr:P-loop containing nucleoside triphosphate hydrolase protein [Desarmillaria tabescens]KAK0458512.1 P-loop containing nucleoside triphosphate hydrolase protein [Desarmillaria tabescens]